jgi:hypothetical protein
MDYLTIKPTDERFARITGLAVVAATLLAMVSVLVI